MQDLAIHCMFSCFVDLCNDLLISSCLTGIESLEQNTAIRIIMVLAKDILKPLLGDHSFSHVYYPLVSWGGCGGVWEKSTCTQVYVRGTFTTPEYPFRQSWGKNQARLDTGHMIYLQSKQNITLLIHIRIWPVSSSKSRLEYCIFTSTTKCREKYRCR